MKTHTEGTHRMPRIVTIEPRMVHSGRKSSSYDIGPDALVREQDRWKGVPYSLDGFVWNEDTTGDVDVTFEEFWEDPARCLGMRPVFTHRVDDKETMFTYGILVVARVGITDGESHEQSPTRRDEAEERLRTLSTEAKAREYDLISRGGGAEIRVERKAYTTLLDIAIQLADLKTGGTIEIDGQDHTLISTDELRKLRGQG